MIGGGRCNSCRTVECRIRPCGGPWVTDLDVVGFHHQYVI